MQSCNVYYAMHHVYTAQERGRRTSAYVRASAVRHTAVGSQVGNHSPELSRLDDAPPGVANAVDEQQSRRRQLQRLHNLNGF